MLKRRLSSRKAVASLANKLNAQHFRPEYIERAIVRSLNRLKTDYIDLFLLHCPSIGPLSEDRLFDRLDRVRLRGMIRHYGVSCEDNVTPEELDISLARPGVTALQIAVNPYRLSTIEEVRKRTGENAIGLIGRSPFAGGALFRDEHALTMLSQSVSATPAQAAIRLATQLNPRGTVLVGMDNRQHLKENLHALELLPYPAESLTALKSLQFGAEPR